MSNRLVLFDPEDGVTAGIADGFAQLATLLAATLGPERGVIWHAVSAGKTEALRDSGVLARRITALSDPAQHTGAMLIRQAALTMHEQYLDGAALIATLAFALLNDARRLIAGGLNPMKLRQGIERGVAAAGAAIMAQAEAAESQETLTQVALTATADPELAAILGEMFDILGKHGAYVVEEYAAPLLDRAYVDGGRWGTRPLAREFMPPARTDLVLDQPLVFVCPDKLETLEQIQAALHFAIQQPGKPPLLIIGKQISGEAMHTLTLNHTRGAVTVAAVHLTGTGDNTTADLEDIALLTGARLAAAERGSPPQAARPDWFGQARQVIITRDSLTVIGGGGSRTDTQRRVTELRGQLRAVRTPDETWERLRLRLARLSGGMGVLKVGALTFQERDERKTRAKKAVRVLETVLDGGTVPGGGVAYLNAIPAVQDAETAEIASANDFEVRAGIALVARALEAPFLTLVAGYGGQAGGGDLVSPAVALHDRQQLHADAGADLGFDVRTGALVPLRAAGVLDSALILQAALTTAASAAIMALTTGVIVVET